MNPEIPKRPGKLQANLRTDLHIIAATILGILATDGGTKPAYSALPKNEELPFSQQIKPGFPSLDWMKKNDAPTRVRDGIINANKSLRRLGAIVERRLNIRSIEVNGIGTPDVDTKALIAVVREELARLDAMQNAEEVKTLASRVQQCYELLEKYNKILRFSEQNLGGPSIDGPTTLLNMLQDDVYRTQAEAAIEEIRAVLNSDAKILEDAFYRDLLETILSIQQSPQPADQ